MPEGNRRGKRIARPGRAIVGLAIVAMALVGCGQQRAAAAPIKIASAFVMQGGGLSSDPAYLVIANSGPADQLLSVRSSAGGRVLFIGGRTSAASAASALSDLSVPGHAVTRLDPSGVHLEIVHPGRLHVGIDITLTLVFAHAGTMRVLAQVSNPATSNGGYLGP